MFCRLDGRNASLHLLSSLHRPPQNPTCHHHTLTKKLRHPKSSKPALPHLRRHLTLWTSEFKLSVCLHSGNDKWRVCVYTLFVCVSLLVWQGTVRGVFRGAICGAAGVSPRRSFAFSHFAKSGHFTPRHPGELSTQEEELNRFNLNKIHFQRLI